MITTKIQIKQHLAEYCYGKYSGGNTDHPVRFPHRTEMYYTIWDLLAKRPEKTPVDTGNLEIVLPCSNLATTPTKDNPGFRKNPKVYNFLSDTSARIIEAKIEAFMFHEIHGLFVINKHKYGLPYSDTVHMFMNKYCIDSVTEDMFLKNRQRWNERLAKRNQRRNK